MNPENSLKMECGGWQRKFDCLSFDVTARVGPVDIALENGVSLRGKWAPDKQLPRVL